MKAITEQQMLALFVYRCAPYRWMKPRPANLQAFMCWRNRQKRAVPMIFPVFPSITKNGYSAPVSFACNVSSTSWDISWGILMRCGRHVQISSWPLLPIALLYAVFPLEQFEHDSLLTLWLSNSFAPPLLQMYSIFGTRPLLIPFISLFLLLKKVLLYIVNG